MKTIEQIDKQIEKLQQEKIKLLTQKSKWLKIPELNIEVEVEVHDEGKSWNELNLTEREDELLTAEECIFLANSKYAKELKMDGSSLIDDFFIKQPFNLNKQNNYVARFSAYSDRAHLNCDRYPSNAVFSLGVRFKRKIRRKK